MTDQTSSDEQPPAERPEHNGDGDAGAARPRRPRRVLRHVLCVVLVVVVGTGAVVFWLMRSEPAHWKRHQQFLRSTSPQELKSIARKVDRQMEALVTLAEDLEQEQTGQNQVVTAAAGTQKPLIKKIHLTIEEANVWITEKVDEWLKYRDYDMPSQISSPMIALDGGKLLLSFELNASGFSQVFTAGFDLEFLENDSAMLQLQNVSAGKLPLPADGIGDYIRSKAPDNPTARRAAGWLDKLDGVEFKPSLKLGEQHKVCVIDYDVAEDGITLTVQVEKRPGYSQPKPPRTQVAAVDE